MKFIFSITTIILIFFQSVCAQSQILIEACNNIENSGKRLLCLQEAMKDKSPSANQQSQLPLSKSNLVEGKQNHSQGDDGRFPVSLKPNVVDGLSWIWPSNGAVDKNFDGVKNRGVDIDGIDGDSVFAASDGVVVFSNSGLNGFGNLIIIKHNNIYLSVYAHNKVLIAKVDQIVKMGEEIAKMGNSESDRVKLHFEVRKYGKSVNPIDYLPSR